MLTPPPHPLYFSKTNKGNFTHIKAIIAETSIPELLTVVSFTYNIVCHFLENGCQSTWLTIDLKLITLPTCLVVKLIDLICVCFKIIPQMQFPV